MLYGLARGVPVVYGTRPVAIVAPTNELLTDSAVRETMTGAVNPYGDGRARSGAASRHHRNGIPKALTRNAAICPLFPCAVGKKRAGDA